MSKIILISCVSKKQELPIDKKIPAKDLYISPLFKKAWQYAKMLNSDRIYIISAKYGLLKPNDLITTYNKTLLNMNKNERIIWSNNIIRNLKDENIDLSKDEFIILAGKAYYQYLLGDKGIQKYSLPYKNCKGIGYILRFLTKKIQENGN